MINDIKLSPMVTAPKDGQPLYICRQDDYVSQAFWISEYEGFYFVDDDLDEGYIPIEIWAIKGWFRLGKTEVIKKAD